MAILTKEQKEKYLADGAQCCPFCGSSDISGSALDVEATTAWQDIYCGHCSEEWQDVYTLTSVETQDEINGK